MNFKFAPRAYQKHNVHAAGPADGLKRLMPTQGMTLPEMMVAVAIGSLILIVMATLFMSSARSFAAVSNYVNMDSTSRNALDQITLEIRQAGALTEFSPTHLKFATAPGQTNSFLVYDWDSGTGLLTEWKTGESVTNTLLTGCDQLAFSLYNSSFAPTTNLSQGKGLSVNWQCSRTVLGKKSTTENVQQALIVIRNK